MRAKVTYVDDVQAGIDACVAFEDRGKCLNIHRLLVLYYRLYERGQIALCYCMLRCLRASLTAHAWGGIYYAEPLYGRYCYNSHQKHQPTAATITTTVPYVNIQRFCTVTVVGYRERKKHLMRRHGMTCEFSDDRRPGRRSGDKADATFFCVPRGNFSRNFLQVLQKRSPALFFILAARHCVGSTEV